MTREAELRVIAAEALRLAGYAEPRLTLAAFSLRDGRSRTLRRARQIVAQALDAKGAGFWQIGKIIGLRDRIAILGLLRDSAH